MALWLKALATLWKGLRLGSQHPHQMGITLHPSRASEVSGTYEVHIHTCRHSHTHTYKIFFKEREREIKPAPVPWRCKSCVQCRHVPLKMPLLGHCPTEVSRTDKYVPMHKHGCHRESSDHSSQITTSKEAVWSLQGQQKERPDPITGPRGLGPGR